MHAVITEQQPPVKQHILRCGERLIAAKGFVGVGNTPDQFSRDLSAEALEWEAVVKKAGARLDE